jgi:hypothetical protein
MADLIYTQKQFDIQLKETNTLINEMQEYISSAQKFIKQINISNVNNVGNVSNVSDVSDVKNKSNTKTKTKTKTNIEEEDDDNDYFSRIEPPYSSICNFSKECNKHAAFYRDLDNVYYCWFHLQACGCKIR